MDKVVQLGFTADRDELYDAWNAIANLADMAGKVEVNIRAESEAGFDNVQMRVGYSIDHLHFVVLPPMVTAQRLLTTAAGRQSVRRRPRKTSVRPSLIFRSPVTSRA